MTPAARPTPENGRPTGALYLIPTPLDHGCDPELQGAISDALPLGTLEVAARLGHWITENAKSTRAFLKRVQAVVPLTQPVQALMLQELPRAVHKKGDHTAQSAASDAKAWLAPALAGHDMGLVSEAGMPAIADPGSSVVRAAHALGLDVRVLSGPVSLMLALAGSGLNGQHFAFVGYLPQEAGARLARLRELESLALRTGQTQIWIETPYRNAAMLQAATTTLNANTWLSVSCGLMVTQPQHKPASRRGHTAQVGQWQRSPPVLDWSLPAVFMIGA